MMSQEQILANQMICQSADQWAQNQFAVGALAALCVALMLLAAYLAYRLSQRP